MPIRLHHSPGHAHGFATRGSMGVLLIAALVLVLASLPVAWWTTDHLESDNDFCNACHLPTGRPLHEGIRQDFDRRPPATLAARHASARHPERAGDSAIRCIDCHGGVGLLGKARIKLLSAKDTLLYAMGRFDEPESMSVPLGEADCRQCHPKIAKKGAGFDGEAFHDQHEYGGAFDVACVGCHTSHATGGDAAQWFLNPEAVRRRCAECHVEYADLVDP